ncbi:TRAP transporter large permease [Acuticoccus sp. 2012]|uniref:TRAP transporter large permease protein n=2 Tax=Acuticoccus mangrovi TaxID=2796142 RepID=A0A934IPP6_9HYPH|nr:TRAP transporter large permease [Acuticoccus mangrovi]MBJ3776450.1 TRAP transporter large permease [Acuticoccus mangrovi]
MGLEPWVPGLVALVVLILLGLPIAFGMGLVGTVGLVLLLGPRGAMSIVGQTLFDTGLSYTLSVVPLFILMGNLVTRAGLSDKLYGACHAWLGARRGGLAMATAVACGGFSAVCGSSLATAATMGKVALPSMRRYGTSDSLAAGVIAAGGTLGILIPPSVILVMYGVTTSQDIGALFIAGVIPGLIGVLGYMAAVRVTCMIDPDAGPRGPQTTLRQKLVATRGVGGVLALFVLVIGGIYAGVFTATEAAGVGAFGAFLIALVMGRLTLRSFAEALAETAATTTMMFAVLTGALVFASYVNVAGLPAALTGLADAADWPPFGVLVAILGVYLVLGMVLESLSMVLLTVPIFAPMVEGLGYDLVWFGILVVVMTEISLITPPVGLNVFVLKTVLPDVSVGTIFKGVIPFILADVVRVALILAIPGLALWLPSLMG